MPIAFVAALAGSLIVHVVALFGPEIDLPEAPVPLTLSAELKPLPATDMAPPAAKPQRKEKKAVPPVSPPLPAVPQPKAEAASEPVTDGELAEVAAQSLPPAKPVLPASGVIRYAVFKSTLAIQIGQSEQRWAFAEDGSYQLQGVTETTGIAAVFKPTRIEQLSRGRLVAGGLQPEHFTTTRNGRETNENADFDWPALQVHLSRDDSRQAMTAGTQDILSLNFQLAYLGHLAHGVSLGVVTGRKYDRYSIDSLGEEEVEVPAGRYRTLHLRAQTETTTDIWIALEQRGLPVKIRFTDKKGESFEQVATEIGMP